MNNTIKSFLSTASLAVLAGYTPLQAENTDTEKPNILFILADDIGYEKLGCYGGVNTFTPNLDEMATKGVIFTKTYGSPVCTPSRMSIYTGCYTPRHKHTTVLPVHLGTKEYVDFNNQFTTYAQLLRDSGYQTSVTGKWQLATLEYHPEHCKSAGFDSWCVWQIWKDGEKTKRYWAPTLNRDGQIINATESDFGPNLLTQYVIDRMKAAKIANQPFLIHHNIMLPHVPIVKTPNEIESGEEASLDHMIAYMDKQVGILLDAINEMGLSSNTYVFFVGDNGTDVITPRMTRNGQVTGGKRTLNDGGTHLPFIALAPGRIPANNKINDLIDFADFFPTLCELASVPIPTNVAPDGISFVNLLTGKGPGQRQWVTSGIYDDFFVFDGEWRLHAKGNALYDCRNLPKEEIVTEESAESQKARKKLDPVIETLKAIAAN